jgi:hypothetical protein
MEVDKCTKCGVESGSFYKFCGMWFCEECHEDVELEAIKMSKFFELKLEAKRLGIKIEWKD